MTNITTMTIITTMTKRMIPNNATKRKFPWLMNNRTFCQLFTSTSPSSSLSSSSSPSERLVGTVINDLGLGAKNRRRRQWQRDGQSRRQDYLDPSTFSSTSSSIRRVISTINFHNRLTCMHQRCEFHSTTTTTTTASSASASSSSSVSSHDENNNIAGQNITLKKLIQPFVLKCHPDLAQQYGLPKSAQRINLTAIQNLNSYVDTVNAYIKSPYNIKNYTFGGSSNNSNSQKHYVEIEFVMAFHHSYDDDSGRNHSGSGSATSTSSPSSSSTSTSASMYKSGRSMTSRRRVELQVPPHPSQLPPPSRGRQVAALMIERHVQRQIVKLLQIADLPVPKAVLSNMTTAVGMFDDVVDGDEDEFGNFDNFYARKGHHKDADNNSRYDDPNHPGSEARRRRRILTKRDVARRKFWNSINWKRFDQLYQDALQDAYADIATKNMIRDNPRARQKLLAAILSKIKFNAGRSGEYNGDSTRGIASNNNRDLDEIDDGDDNNNGSTTHNTDGTDHILPIERLVAYRRLLRLFDEHFDELQLEDLGRFWEELVTAIVVTKARPYNTSSSALRKRRRRQLETGYSFTIHHDDTVTIQIPIDFTNDELIQELRRNIRDFVCWTQQDDQNDYYDWMMGGNTNTKSGGLSKEGSGVVLRP